MPKISPAHPVRNILELKLDYKALADKQVNAVSNVLGQAPASVSNGFNPAYLQHPKYEFSTQKELDKAVKKADHMLNQNLYGVKEVVRRRTRLPPKRRPRLRAGVVFSSDDLSDALFGGLGLY